jgi:hypothetical protein
MKYIALIFVAVWLSVIHLSAQLVSEMVEYHPAPGQLTNTDGAGSYNAARTIVGSIDGLVSLGSYGGNVVYRFDIPVENDPANPYGVDFVIFGNPKSDWAEPGIVMVMKDENKNGKPDDIWYELAGSDYFFSTTNHQFSVTYKNPLSSGAADVPWYSSDSRSGYIFSNSFHKQFYYPSLEFYDWNISDTVSFSGTLINDEVDFSNPAFIKSYQRKFGYADNIIRKNSNYNLPDNPYTNEVEGCGGDAMDIGWAVDRNGNYVDLDQIDFVKIYTGVLANAGWMGEISTEICGIADVSANSAVTGLNKCIVVNHVPLKLFSGKSYPLEAKAFQNGRSLKNAKIIWNVDNEQLASINSDGLLNLKKNGTLKISASLAADPTIANSQNIEIISPAKIDIVLESTTIMTDEETEVKAIVKDDSQNILSGVETEWSVQNNGVVSLTEKGGKYYIKGLSKGNCLLEVHLKNKLELNSSVTVTVLSESAQKEIFITVKNDQSTLVPRNKILVTNFNLNPFVDQAKGNYSIEIVKDITVAHALAQLFINSGFAEDFRFRDDERGGSKLYVWKVPKGDPSNVEYIYGYGGFSETSSYSKSWIVLLNNEQIINNFDQHLLKNGDELILYHVADITKDWKVTCFIANKDEVTLEDTVEVYSTELTCNKGEDGNILIKSSSPLQNLPIWVNDQAAYFNGDRVVTDETGMAALQFNQPGIKKIMAGIDELILTVKQKTSSSQKIQDLIIKIWPQPAKGALNVLANNQKISSLKIFDTSGRCLLYMHGDGRIFFTLKTDEITSGIYILQLSTIQGIFNRKIILQ